MPFCQSAMPLSFFEASSNAEYQALDVVKHARVVAVSSVETMFERVFEMYPALSSCGAPPIICTCCVMHTKGIEQRNACWRTSASCQSA